MNIKLAKDCGFCFGVKRAMEKVEDILKNRQFDKKIYSLGPLIHNPQVVNKLKDRGVEIIDDINNIDDCILIIRSHGVPPCIFESADKKNIEIIDATCPFVAFAQNICCLLKKEEYQIVIIGELEHPEVKALLGYAGDNSIVIKSRQDIDLKKLKPKIGVLSQTTQPKDSVSEIVQELIMHNFKEVRFFDTICDATSKRQESALEIAKYVDAMIVIGGHNSSNTKKLAALCAEHIETYHIESKEGINVEKILDKKKIGITAGASTPSWIIEEVIEKIK